jgi:hypothetical protein
MNAVQQHGSPGIRTDRAWSYSQLKSFELCPKNWAAYTYYKNVRDKDNDFTTYGKDVHKALELRVKKDKPLPLDLKHHEAAVQRFVSSVPNGRAMTEVRIGIDKAFNQVDFFASTVWCRAVIDLIVYNDDVALIVDWKTGKVRPDFDQLDLMAAMAFCLIPTLKGVVGKFYWTKEKDVTSKKYPAAEIKNIWQGFLPRVARFQQSIRQEEFPARPNFKCRSFCGVSACQHHSMNSG